MRNAWGTGIQRSPAFPRYLRIGVLQMRDCELLPRTAARVLEYLRERCA